MDGFKGFLPGRGVKDKPKMEPPTKHVFNKDFKLPSSDKTPTGKESSVTNKGSNMGRIEMKLAPQPPHLTQ